MRLIAILFALAFVGPAVADPAARAHELRAAVAAKNIDALAAALAPNFAVLACSANPLKACAPDKVKSIGAKTAKPLDRLRLALCCEGKPAPDMPQAEQNDTLFAILGATLATATLAPNPNDKKAVCTPALPAFDRAKAAKSAKVAGVEPENLRIAGQAITLRERPAPDSAVAATLASGDVVALVAELTNAPPAGWTAVSLGKDRIGYTDALGLEDLTPAALCFTQNKGVWSLAYFIQRGA